MQKNLYDKKVYYKHIPKEYCKFKTTLNTDDCKYGKFVFESMKKMEKYFLFFFELDNKFGFGLDLYLCMYNHICGCGIKNYVESMAYFIYDFRNNIDIYKLTNNDENKGEYISKSDFNNICNLICYFLRSNSEILLDSGFGTNLQEYIFDKVRIEKYPDKLCRLESYFVFNDINSCKIYSQSWDKTGEIVRIVPISIENLFKGDMNHIDTIKNSATYTEYLNIADMYWQQKNTHEPIEEIFFRGTYRMEKI